MHESIAAPDLYVKRIMGHYTRYAANSDRTRGAQPGLFPILQFLSQTALRLLILLRFGLLLLFIYLLFLHLAFVFLPAFVSHGGSFPCTISRCLKAHLAPRKLHHPLSCYSFPSCILLC